MQHRVDAIAQSLPASGWKRLSAGFGSKGERLYDWALMPLSKQEGWARALLVRRSIEEKPECAYYLCYPPAVKTRLKPWSEWPANAGRSSKPSKPDRKSTRLNSS